MFGSKRLDYKNCVFVKVSLEYMNLVSFTWKAGWVGHVLRQFKIVKQYIFESVDDIVVHLDLHDRLVRQNHPQISVVFGVL